VLGLLFIASVLAYVVMQLVMLVRRGSTVTRVLAAAPMLVTVPLYVAYCVTLDIYAVPGMIVVSSSAFLYLLILLAIGNIRMRNRDVGKVNGVVVPAKSIRAKDRNG
jgi:hypothetical protein